MPYFVKDKWLWSIARRQFKFPSGLLARPDIDVNEHEQTILQLNSAYETKISLKLNYEFVLDDPPPFSWL